MPESCRPSPADKSRHSEQEAARRTGLNRNREGVIDKILNSAMQQQDWQDLKGKGQRLNLEPPVGVPADQLMGNKIMQDNDVAPVWIEDRKALLHRIETWRQQLRARMQALGVAARPSQPQQTVLRQEVEALNKAIQDLNIAIPIFRLELVQLDLAEEIRRAQKA